MSDIPEKITLEQWDARHPELVKQGMVEPGYGGPLGRHLGDGDLRLKEFLYDNSAASLDLWNFLLTEEERLQQARESGKKLVGAMKDLGTVPVMAYSLQNVAAFYPDGAWWIPCVMQLSAGLLGIADSLGIDESFCPVRAMLGAFVTEAHFPIPDLLTCSVGAVCDDFSVIAQRLNGLGNPILWWEVPHRREPDDDEETVELPGGSRAPREQLNFVRGELCRIRTALESLSGERLDDDAMRSGIETANRVRKFLDELRHLTFTVKKCPLPALELLVAEMLAIHFCSDREESLRVLSGLLDEVKRRAEAGEGVLPADAVRVFWVNPVADLRVMNWLEESGGRLCGTEYLFTHALDQIPTDLPPIDALARMALADPMVGSSSERALRICSDIRTFGSEAVLVSRIPGASHCALEGSVIGDIVESETGLPVIEIEVPPVSDALRPGLCNKMQALVEAARLRRQK